MEKVTFAGAPHNFGYNTAGVNGNPLSPAVTTVPIPPTEYSKIVPGQPNSQLPTPGQQTTAAPASPLDQYLKLFDTVPVDPNAPAKEPTVLDATTQHFSEASKKLNFVKDIPADKLALMEKGGSAGVAAMLEVIQTATQQAFAHSAATSTSITKQGFELKSGDFDARVAQGITLATASTELATLNPTLLSAAFQPVVAQVQQKLLQQTPGMDGKTLAAKTAEYFKLAQPAAAPATTEPTEGGNGLADFWKSLNK